MIYTINFTTKTRATTGPWGSGSLESYITSALAGNFTYNGQAQSPITSNILSYVTVTDGTQSATNKGTYSVTLRPKMQYKWSDGTYGDKTLTWTISPAQQGCARLL